MTMNTQPPARITATDAAIDLLRAIQADHGAVIFHQSGGCCDGSSPMCYPASDFRLGERDVLLGHVAGAPVYIGADQHSVWQHTQLILDCVDGRGGMFSLDNGRERRFLTRSRIFTADEQRALAVDAMHQKALIDPDRFWLEEAHKRLNWMHKPSIAGDWSFDADDFHIRWFSDGVLNVSVECLDRHLATRADQVAIRFEGDAPGEGYALTYRELHGEVCRMANVLRGLGVGKGDCVTLYLPMVPEAAVAMLACARIGAIHSAVFGGFSPESLASRIRDCGSRLLITANEGVRGGRVIPLKSYADQAVAQCPAIDHILVIARTATPVPMVPGRDIAWADARATQADTAAPEPMAADDPLFILYTSGSTGAPKGVVHSTGGYLLWVSLTFDLLFGATDQDLFWCTADIGWITGHSYVVYGPLCNGASTVMFDGVPNYPDHGRLWETTARLGVTILYTAPTAIRALMGEGDDWVTAHDRSRLRLLGSVGEPINPEAWDWYHRVVGDGRCPIIDTWWQTETGGALIAPIAGTAMQASGSENISHDNISRQKPGSATRPLPGVHVALVDADGRVLDGATSGNLVLTHSWPGQMRGVWGDAERFFQAYFSTYPGAYFTGDGCRRDDDGDYWITGRVDDVINISGHRMGTAEVESALVAHPDVAEAAIVGVPHPIKGQAIYAYVTLNAGLHADDGLTATLRQWVRAEIGPIASPDFLQFTRALPKTRSGKIMRRILRKIAEGDVANLGDISTLADPSVVDQLVAGRLGDH